MRAERVVLLQRVDRDDRLVVVVERVVVRRDLLAHTLEPDRVEADQRNGEARPQLLLELREHALHRRHEDASPAAAADELREQDARLERLAEPDRVGDQDPRARLLERQPGWLELEVHHVERGVAPEDRLGRGRRHASELALEVQPGLPVACGGVSDELCLARVEHRDLRLVLLEEDRLLVPDDLRDADHMPRRAPAARLVDLRHAPDGVPHLDVRARRYRELPRHRSTSSTTTRPQGRRAGCRMMQRAHPIR